MSLSWVTILWSMVAAMCLTIAGVHLLVWSRHRSAWGNLSFALAALAIAGTAVAEFLLMRAPTPEAYAAALRWSNVPITLVVVGMLGFVHVNLAQGRAWIAWTAIGLRLLTQVLHHATGQTVQFREITALGQISFLGEPVSVVAEAVRNPWSIVPLLSNVAVLVYVVDASFRRWRSGLPGQRARALWLGLSVTGFVFVASAVSALNNQQVTRLPYLVTPSFVFILLAMSFELSRSLLRSFQVEGELRQSETQLRETEDRLALAAEAAGLGFWSWNPSTNALWISDRARGIGGFPPDTPVTFDLARSRVHPEDWPTLEAHLAAAQSGKGGFRAECRLLLPDGRVTWISVRGNLAAEFGGGSVLMTGIVTDISERRRAELEILEQRSELAHLSRVNMLGELSGSLAHELNQPLTSILSNAQAAQKFLAGDSADLGEVREILADIVAEDKRAGEIIRGLRSLLKRGEERSVPLDVNELVTEVLRIMRSDLVNQGVTVQTALTPNLPIVPGDRVQFQQVLINLLMNACDAMAEAGPDERRIHVSTGLDEPGSVRVAVADQGTGIDPEKLQRIFDPFYTSKPAGMGLGLAVCRTIITAHGGRLWASNNPGRGATVHFSLPVEGRRREPGGVWARARQERTEPAGGVSR